MVLFHSPYKSNRLSYVLDYVFIERLGINYELSESVSNIVSPHKVCINYSDIRLENAWNFIPDGLLNTSEIGPLKQHYTPANSENSNINELDFDVFSAIFFHLSRYEEYLTKKRDEHGRFQFSDSVLFKSNCLKFPLVDLWIAQLKDLLITQYHFSIHDFKPESYHSVSTIDIDSVFAYKAKPLFRQMAALSKDLLSGRFNEVRNRLSVVIGRNQDPNDNFDWQLSALGNKTAMYFIQSGPYGPYDKNISPLQNDFKKILQKLIHAGHTIGLHPSYSSDSKSDAILREKNTLEKSTNTSVTSSRQHFLKMDLPKTYRALIDCGIHHDYSMGYSHVPGFRAATAHAFKWFDLIKDAETTLTVHPFCCMDVAYKQFMKLSVDECITDSDMIIKQLKSLNAPFVFVFHNESLSGHRGWKNWDKVFKHWINE